LHSTDTAVKPAPPVKLTRFFTVIGNIIFACLLLIMAALVFFMVKSNLDGGHPNFAGYNLYIVLSGSMSPAFDAGSVVIVKPLTAEEVTVGDIITFKDTQNRDTLVTHRVTAIDATNGLTFTTRGDANNVDDFTPVPAANLVGRVQTAVPYFGYVVNFARTKKGLLSLVIIPGILIIIFEFRNLMVCAGALEKEKKAKEAAKKALAQPETFEDKEVTAGETREMQT
jgi:signal peptidase